MLLFLAFFPSIFERQATFRRGFNFSAAYLGLLVEMLHEPLFAFNELPAADLSFLSSDSLRTHISPPSLSLGLV